MMNHYKPDAMKKAILFEPKLLAKVQRETPVVYEYTGINAPITLNRRVPGELRFGIALLFLLKCMFRISIWNNRLFSNNN